MRLTLALGMLSIACTSQDTDVSSPSEPSGCIAGSVAEYCDVDPVACDVRTLHLSSALDHFFACEGWDAGTCCDDDDEACRADRVSLHTCTCTERESTDTFTAVRLSTGFDGRGFYFDRSGDLVAAAEWVDTNAYCGHTSAERWYGARLDCRCRAATRVDAG